MEKDGTGYYTDKPKSEWRRKNSGKRKHYWEKWSDDKEVVSAETAEALKIASAKRKPNHVEITTKDICWFLQKRLVVGEPGQEEEIDYKQIEKFTMALLHVIADLLIDNCIVQLDDIGTIRSFTRKTKEDAISLTPHLRPNKDLLRRINVTGDKFIARTYNIGYEIRDEREERQRVAERMHENYIKRKEAQNDENNDEG